MENSGAILGFAFGIVVGALLAASFMEKEIEIGMEPTENSINAALKRVADANGEPAELVASSATKRLLGLGYIEEKGGGYIATRKGERLIKERFGRQI